MKVNSCDCSVRERGLERMFAVLPAEEKDDRKHAHLFLVNIYLSLKWRSRIRGLQTHYRSALDVV